MIHDYEATQPIVPERDRADNEGAIATLNKLLEICKDGQYGFETAAEGIENAQLKNVFRENARQRGEFASVLRGLVQALGGEPETGGSISGAVHRGWMDIKSAVSGGDEHSILTECERGEDYAKEAYNEALNESLPPDIADVIAQQHQAVIATHNKIKALRDSGADRAATARP